MADPTLTKFTDFPAKAGLDGDEAMWVTQAGADFKVSAAQVASMSAVDPVQVANLVQATQATAGFVATNHADLAALAAALAPIATQATLAANGTKLDALLAAAGANTSAITTTAQGIQGAVAAGNALANGAATMRQAANAFLQTIATNTAPLAGTVPVSIGSIVNVALSGTPAVAIAGSVAVTGSVSATINGQPIQVQNPAAAAAITGKAIFGGSFAGTLTTALAPAALLINTSATKTLYLDATTICGAVLAQVVRSRGPLAAASGTAVTVTNRAGGSATPAGKLYSGPTLPTNATPERYSYVPPSGSEVVAAGGTVAIPPGGYALWQIQALGTLTALTGYTFEATWWEAP